ncbi:MAG: hypothetical protein AAB618_00345 [Patescibacteria group bacterium]
MINLIPFEAKKHLVHEYWLRSVTVWFFLWSFVLLLGIVILIPSYVLINLQVKAYTASAETADEKNASFENVAKELERASQTAVALSDRFAHPSMTEYVSLFRGFESNSLRITQISLRRDETGIKEVKVAGTAEDRRTLAAFRTRMLDDERIETVDLPISNLAKDRDIPFDLSITMAKEKNL